MDCVESNSKSQRNFSISEEQEATSFSESAGIAINKIVRERGGFLWRRWRSLTETNGDKSTTDSGVRAVTVTVTGTSLTNV
jgi:hypothetical protein